MNKEYRLPYLNNAGLIIVTILINFAAVLPMILKGQVTTSSLCIDGAFFGVVTSFIDVFTVWFILRRYYRKGMLPSDAPVSVYLERLPRTPLLLSLVFGMSFAVIVSSGNWLCMTFYEKESLEAVEFIVWRIVYSIVVSAYIIKLAVMRFLQKGFFGPSVKQHGTEKVLNAIPHISTFRNLVKSALTDFGINMLLGVFLGGTIINADHTLTIAASTKDGIVFSGLILSVILMFLLVIPVVKSVWHEGKEKHCSIIAEKKVLLAFLPKNPVGFAWCLFVPIAGISVLFLWGVMIIFHFEVLNFFQFYFIRVILMNFLTDFTVFLSVKKYSQPD